MTITLIIKKLNNVIVFYILKIDLFSFLVNL